MTFSCLIQGKTIPGLREYSASEAEERHSQGIWGKRATCRALEGAPGKQAMVGQ